MAQAATNDIKPGMKVKVDGEPYVVVSNEFVKPGKGRAINRIRLKNLLQGRVVDKTYTSGDKLDLADVAELQMRMLYKEAEGIVFMDDKTYEQFTIPLSMLDNVLQWLMEDRVYTVTLYNGNPISVEPPTFVEMKIVESDPGVKGDTASGRVLKPAKTESGAFVQIPLFVDVGEVVKIDTRTGEYVSRVKEK